MRLDAADRNLTEMAALAANVTITWSEEYGRYFLKGAELGQRLFWDPLNDDGDAFRLAVQLMLSICGGEPILIDTFGYGRTRFGEYELGVDVWYTNKLGKTREFSEAYGLDARAATRRCIVRAAADIGGAS